MESTMHVRGYRVLLREEPEGGYTVIVPALPGCVTYGENISEAMAMTSEAIDLCLESLQAHGEEIPSEEHTLAEQEAKQAAGYNAQPVQPGEFDGWESEQVWGEQ